MPTTQMHLGMIRSLLVCVCWWLRTISPATAATPEVAWTGEGKWRILVRVDPVALNGRQEDEMVARYKVDFVDVLAKAHTNGGVDLASLQVQKFDPATGAAEVFKPFDNARSRYDRPCRFDDESVPEDYPDHVGRASNQKDGRPPVTIRKRGGRLFNREQDNNAGQIVWVHAQQANKPSYYAIYFNISPPGQPAGTSPAPWIGDVDVLRSEKDQPLGGLGQFTMGVGDLNGDGLFDLVAGDEKGNVMWFPNRGLAGHPRFVGCRMLTDDEGPIDTGWYAAPFLYDWDSDGLLDLLVGTSGNVIVWWKNVGTKTQPHMRCRGFVQSDGRALRVPESPVPELKIRLGGRLADEGPGASPEQNSSVSPDYYNQPWVGDWDGDGLPDILTGGYTTGLIFYYHATGRSTDGVPTLRYEGPLEADSQPLDTTWAASPTAYDFDGDGELELVTGSWWWSGIQHPPAAGQVEYLMYYRNEGTRASPRLHRSPLPRTGTFPRGEIARASVADWDNDGLPDLIVSDGGGSIYVFRNVGSRQAPEWSLNSASLTTTWGFVRSYSMVGSAADMYGNARIETISGNQFYRSSGPAYSPKIEASGSATVNGGTIEHPGPGYGDPDSFTYLRDWDRDGHPDLFWSTQQGNIYWHRALGGDNPHDFAPGVKLKLTTGDDLRVGPPVMDSPDKVHDFETLQGARARFVIDDFNGDGIDDLAVTEANRNLWIFLNTRTGGTDTLRPGVLVGKLTHIDDAGATMSVIDWNRDGKPDLITGGTAEEPGMVFINQSTSTTLALAKPVQAAKLPYVFWGPQFRSTDWNGDGDEDLLIQSEFYSFWAERSFLDHGYCDATALSELQTGPSARK